MSTASIATSGASSVALRRTLVKQRDAGTPWRARDAAEILALLDMTAWMSVLGLLDECPVLPAALTAVLEGRTTTVSATAFDFISTAAQIGDVRIFMRKLPDAVALTESPARRPNKRPSFLDRRRPVDDNCQWCGARILRFRVDEKSLSIFRHGGGRVQAA